MAGFEIWELVFEDLFVKGSIVFEHALEVVVEVCQSQDVFDFFGLVVVFDIELCKIYF